MFEAVRSRMISGLRGYVPAASWSCAHPTLLLEFLLLCVTSGPRPPAPLPHPGPEAAAVAGDQSQGALWLRVEGAAARRVHSGENLPHPGVYRPSALPKNEQ